MSGHYPSNQINSVGFPEGQLLANGATKDECAEISAAFIQGKPMPQSDNPNVNRVIDLLEQHPDYNNSHS